MPGFREGREKFTSQHIASHQEVEADTVLLNVPQLPLLRLLSASAEASLGWVDGAMFWLLIWRLKASPAPQAYDTNFV